MEKESSKTSSDSTQVQDQTEKRSEADNNSKSSEQNRVDKESSKTSTEGVNLCIVAAGKTYGTNVRMFNILSDRIQNLSTVSSVDESDVVLVFCPIVSRAGTDIEAALKRFTDSTASKLKVLVVLHHTFDREKTVPDSSRCVNRTDILTVDCLFYEDTGLLECQKNDDAIDKVVNWLIQQGKKIGVNARPCQTPSWNIFSRFFPNFTMLPNIMKTENSKPCTELYKKSKHIEETERRLAESDKKIKNLETDKNELLKDIDELQKQIQCKDKTIQEQDKLLQKTIEELSQTTREVEEKQKLIVEINKKLENMKKLLSEKETAPKRAVVEMEGSKCSTTLRTELQENVRQLQDERIIKKPSSQSAVQLRRNSKDIIEPEMSGETSNPGCLDSGSELRLVLLGSAGCEKSSAGNIILNREKNQTDTSAETQQSESRQEEVDGKQVTVVETPDWFCPGLSLEEVRQDVRRCIRLSAPGPHAFLLVIPVQQSTGVEREMMEEIFGERCWRNTMIIFTVTDEEQEKNIEGFVQSENQEVQRLVEKCGNRFHGLNIHQSEDGSQVSELLEKIEKMMEGKTEKFYSSEIYLEVESQIRAMKRKIVRDREERKEREEREIKERIEKEVQNFLRKIEGVIEEHEGDIKQVNERTGALERQMREERDEEKKKELMRELEEEVEKRTELERNINRLKLDREWEKSVMEERHRREMEEIRQMYEGEIRFEAERSLMKNILPELQRHILDSELKMQEKFSRQMEEKNRELETLKNKYSSMCEFYESAMKILKSS